MVIQEEDVEDRGGKRLDCSDIAKNHIQRGHDTVSCLRRLLQASGFLFSDQDVYDAVRLCGGGREDDMAQRPAVTNNLPSTAGDTISLDICYPWNSDRGYPRCVTIDRLARFISAKFAMRVDRECIIAEFLDGWAKWIGFPKRILVDAGSVFGGAMFADLPNAYGRTAISSPVGAPYQTGKVERIVQSLKKSFRAIHECNLPNLDHHSKLALSVLAHNATPCSGSNVSHATALTGRTEFLEELFSTPLIPHDNHHQSGAYQFFDRMNAIRSAQAAIIKYDASRDVQTCIRRNTHTGTLDVLRSDDLVDIWIPQKHRWRGAYRVLHDTGRNVILENQGKLLKRPKAWTRLRSRQEAASIPGALSSNADKVVSDNLRPMCNRFRII